MKGAGEDRTGKDNQVSASDKWVEVLTFHREKRYERCTYLGE